MLSAITSRVSLTWATLVVLTVGAFALGSGHGLSGTGNETVGIFIFAIAVFKARLIGLYFMELRSAPAVLRGLFETFCVALLAVLITAFVL